MSGEVCGDGGPGCYQHRVCSGNSALGDWTVQLEGEEEKERRRRRRRRKRRVEWAYYYNIIHTIHF